MTLGGLALASNPFISLAKHIPGTLVRGIVRAKGKGISGVVVSDGFSVVLTNEAGKYEIPYNPEAEFVFISTPSGYEFIAHNSIAGTYVKVSENNYDFDIVLLRQSDEKHRMIVWADPQIKDKQDVDMFMSATVPDVIQFMKEADPLLTHGIAVGDLIWDNHKRWKDYRKAIGEIGIPFYQAIGNHDSDLDNGGDKGSDVSFKREFGPTYYSFNRGKAHYVILDDVRFTGPGKKYDGFITPEQLNWLEKDLSFVPRENVVFIALHIPVHSVVKNRMDLYKVLQGFPKVHILSGHTHTNRNSISNNVYEHVHGTVCGAFWTSDICTDGAPSGYGIYEINGANVSWKYKGTQKDLDYQFRVDVQALSKKQKRVMLNVWNYDPAWKISCTVDGKHIDTLEQVKGYDPLAVKLYLGDKLPIERRAWIEPARATGLFMFHINDKKAKELSVEVIDRFGNIYSQKINI